MQPGRSWSVVQGVTPSNTLEVTMSTKAELYAQEVVGKGPKGTSLAAYPTFAWPQTTAVLRAEG